MKKSIQYRVNLLHKLAAGPTQTISPQVKSAIEGAKDGMQETVAAMESRFGQLKNKLDEINKSNFEFNIRVMKGYVKDMDQLLTIGGDAAFAASGKIDAFGDYVKYNKDIDPDQSWKNFYDRLMNSIQSKVNIIRTTKNITNLPAAGAEIVSAIPYAGQILGQIPGMPSMPQPQGGYPTPGMPQPQTGGLPLPGIPGFPQINLPFPSTFGK